MKKLSLFFLFVLGSITMGLAQTQTFPFRVSVSLKQPLVADWTYFVDDFYQPLTVNVLFNDFQQGTLDYHLRLTIKNLNTDETSVAYLATPQTTQTATAGVMQSISGSDLLPYFENLKGSLKGRPSDGNYQFCFEVIDPYTQRVLSNVGCAMGFIQTIRNPVIITPEQNSQIEDREFLSIPMQWQLMNGVNPILAQKIEYIVKLYEINDYYKGNLLLAEKNGQAQLIFTSDALRETRYNYGMPNADPPLRKGARYLWKVQARHIDDLPIFEGIGVDQGVSTPAIFTLQKPTNTTDENDLNALQPDDEDHVILAMTVKDKVTGKKLQNAQVSFSAEDQPLIQEKTNAEGEIIRSDFVPTTYQIKIQAKGYEVMEQEMIVERNLRNVKFHLIPLPSSIQGQIVDNSNDKPIAEAKVELMRVKEDGSDESVAAIATDKEGKYKIDNILGAGEYFLNVQKLLYENYRSLPFNLQTEENKTLKTYKIGNKIMGIMYGSVKGKVSSLGRAVPNHEVYVMTQEQYTTYMVYGTLPTEKPLKARTTATGTYEVKLVPAILKNEKGYIVVAIEGESVKDGHKEVQIFEQNDSPTADFDLEPQPFRLMGLVKNETEEMVTGAVVELYEQDNKTIAKITKTDGEGKFFMDGLLRKKGGYGKLMVSGGNYKPVTVTDIFADDTKRTYETDITLKFNNSVTGIVKDQFGEVVSGAKIVIEDKETTSDKDGKFKLEGLQTVRQKTANFSFLGIDYEQVFTLPASAEYQLELSVIALKKRFAFNIVDAEGKYPANLSLTAYLQEASNETAGRVLKEWKITDNRPSYVINLELPEDFVGKKIQFMARNENGVSRLIEVLMPTSKNAISPTDLFFTRSQKVTINMQKAFAKVTVKVTEEGNGAKLTGATVALKGGTQKGKTANGEYIFEALPVLDKYEFTVSYPPDYEKKTLLIENKADRSKAVIELSGETKLKKSSLQAAIKKLYGFEVEVSSIKIDENSSLAKLDGSFKVPKEQNVVPSEAEEKDDFYLLPFKNIAFNTEKMAVEKPTANLAEEMNILIDDAIKAQMKKVIISEGKITAKTVSISKIEAAGEFEMSDIFLSNTEIVIGTAKSSSRIEKLAVTTIGEEVVSETEVKLGDYAFKAKKAEFVREEPESREFPDYWVLVFDGSFNFPNSGLYSDKDATVVVSGFSKEEDEALSAGVGGVATFNKNPIFVIAKLSYDAENAQLTGDEARVEINTGLGFAVPLGAESVTIDKNGFLEDCFVSFKAEGENLTDVVQQHKDKKAAEKAQEARQEAFAQRVAQLEANVKAKMTREKAIAAATVWQERQDRRDKIAADTKRVADSTAERARKETSYAKFDLEGARLSTQGRDIKVSVEGDVSFKIGKAPIKITEFSYSTGGAITFRVEKGKSEAQQEDDAKEQDEYKDSATGEKRPEKPEKGGISIELESITAEINWGDPKSTYFTITGKLAMGVPSLQVKVGRITVGGKRWGGQFGVVANTTSWTAEGYADVDWITQDDGSIKFNYAVGGKLWIQKGQKTEIQMTFSFMDTDKRWEFAFMVSKEQKEVSGFRVIRLGGILGRNKENGRWTIGASAGFAKGEGESLLKVDIDNLLFEFGGGEGFVMTLTKASFAYGKKVEGRGSFIIDVGNKKFSGALVVKIKLEAAEFEGQAGWTMDFKNNKYALMLGIKFTLLPAIDLRGKLYLGNAIQEIVALEKQLLDPGSSSMCNLESTTINQGFYLMIGIEKKWEFNGSWGPIGVYAYLGYKIQVAIGLEIAQNPAIHLGFSLFGELGAGITLFGIPIVSIDAELCIKVTARLYLNPVYVEGEGLVYVKVKVCVLIFCAEATIGLKAELRKGSFKIESM